MDPVKIMFFPSFMSNKDKTSRMWENQALIVVWNPCKVMGPFYQQPSHYHHPTTGLVELASHSHHLRDGLFHHSKVGRDQEGQ